MEYSFVDFFKSQTFVHKNQMSYWGILYSVDKKRAMRFVKQNVNRWITPMRKVRKEAEDMAKQYYEDYVDIDDGLFDERMDHQSNLFADACQDLTNDTNAEQPVIL